MRAPPSFSIQDLLGQPLPPEIVQATSPNSRLAARCFQNSSILFLHLFLVLFYFLSISLCVFSCSYVFCVAQMCVCVCVCVCVGTLGSCAVPSRIPLFLLWTCVYTDTQMCWSTDPHRVSTPTGEDIRRQSREELHSDSCARSFSTLFPGSFSTS